MRRTPVPRRLLGAKPADLPATQSSKFELVVNLAVAGARSGLLHPCRQNGGGSGPLLELLLVFLCNLVQLLQCELLRRRSRSAADLTKELFQPRGGHDPKQ